MTDCQGVALDSKHKQCSACATRTPEAIGARAFLLAGIQAKGRYSVDTTVPNGTVAPIHDRMPIVLGPGESDIWLGSDFASLADRSKLRLECEREIPRSKREDKA